MIINRIKLLKSLETVAPGLAKSSREQQVEQGECFVFQNGKAITFNDEVSCSTKCPIGIEGAVPAKPLLDLLRKLEEDQIDLSLTEKGLSIKGKGRRANIRIEKEIVLPVECVEDAEEWQPLPEDFAEAIKIVASCCSSDKEQFLLTCVNVTPSCLEASDNFQACRFSLDMPIEKSTLVRKDSLAKAAGLGMMEIGESENWLHFRNSNGLVLSCRRYMEQYYNLDAPLSVSGEEAELPKDIQDILAKCAIFSNEDTVTGGLVDIELKSGMMRIWGRGPSGWFNETKKIVYDGKPMKFSINPKLLLEVVKHTDQCEIGKGAIVIKTEKFVYMSCTTNPDRGDD